MNDRQRYEQGMKVRRAVLGDDHVDASLKTAMILATSFRICSRATPGEKSASRRPHPPDPQYAHPLHDGRIESPR